MGMEVLAFEAKVPQLTDYLRTMTLLQKATSNMCAQAMNETEGYIRNPKAARLGDKPKLADRQRNTLHHKKQTHCLAEVSGRWTE